jgi:uncharacterized protein YbgA (DUF1722 family)/uncharacterized protein YbbK (DUF523 family)
MDKIRIGISSCLLGQKVRFDAGHKYNEFINEQLSAFFEYVPVCPEVAAGMGIPRPPIRLVAHHDSVQALNRDDAKQDFSAALRATFYQAEARLNGICGYILKKGSPSCGMARVKVYHPSGIPATHGSGIFAQTLMQHWPVLPLEEEGRLNDPHLRENFIERVFVYARWQDLNASGLSAKTLVDFHSRHKLLLMAHSQAAYRRLGQMIAQAGSCNITELAQTYGIELMQALKRPATNKGHANVLQHLMGYLKKHIDSGDKAELLETIEAYRRTELPLIVPITLLKHHFRRHPDPYVATQIYLTPHPTELLLRNRI